jgi:hypothetical protein
MLEGGRRRCNVCGREIPSTEDYCAISIPAADAKWLDPFLNAQEIKRTEDAEGNLKLNVCSKCRAQWWE